MQEFKTISGQNQEDMDTQVEGISGLEKYSHTKEENMQDLKKLSGQEAGDMQGLENLPTHIAKPTKSLGILKSITLKEYWNNEPKDFTPWLNNNLNLLGEAIDLDLESEGTEQSVGSCRVDILARSIDEEDHFVVIENQLEGTDHKHLGQLLTYATTGLSEKGPVKTVVWVASEFKEEHKKALDWLNDNSAENMSFYGLEVELLQIGDSLPAPRFSVVSQPLNNISKAKETINKKSENLELKRKQLDFWTGFVEYMKNERSPLSLTRPKKQHLYRIRMGRSDCKIRLTTNSQTNRLGCELRIKENDPVRFNAFKQQKDIIEKDLNISPNEQLQWNDAPEKSKVILQHRENSDFQNRDQWPQMFAWLKERAEAFEKVFSKRIQELELSKKAA